MSDRSVVVPGRTPPRGAYPHLRLAGDLVFVSGTSARRLDGTIDGATVDADGTATLDIRVQTRAVLDNIAALLEVGRRRRWPTSSTSLVPRDDGRLRRATTRSTPSTSRPRPGRPAPRWRSTSCPTRTWPSRSRRWPAARRPKGADVQPIDLAALDRGAPGAAAAPRSATPRSGTTATSSSPSSAVPTSAPTSTTTRARSSSTSSGATWSCGSGRTVAPGTSRSARARCFLLPAHVRHSPQRPVPGSVGLVIERPARPVRSTASSGTARAARRWSTGARCSSSAWSTTCPRPFAAFYDDERARTCPELRLGPPGSGSDARSAARRRGPPRQDRHDRRRPPLPLLPRDLAGPRGSASARRTGRGCGATGPTEAMVMIGSNEFRPITSACWDAAVRAGRHGPGRRRPAGDLGDARAVRLRAARPSTPWSAPASSTTRCSSCARAGQGRLVPIGQVPLQDTDLACRELERCLAAGMKGVQIGNHVGDRDLDDDGAGDVPRPLRGARRARCSCTRGTCSAGAVWRTGCWAGRWRCRPRPSSR